MSSISLDFHSKPGDGNCIGDAIAKITYNLFFMIFYLMTVYKRFFKHKIIIITTTTVPIIIIIIIFKLFLEGIAVPVNISAFSTTVLPLP